MTCSMERRRHSRITTLLQDEEQVQIETGKQWVPARIVNLSVAGALLEMPDSDVGLPAGETLDLFFDNGGQPLQIAGTVVRAEEGRIAFAFADLSPDVTTAIHTKLIRMAIIAQRVIAMDGNEMPQDCA